MGKAKTITLISPLLCVWVFYLPRDQNILISTIFIQWSSAVEPQLLAYHKGGDLHCHLP
jgi:hypothetical protein